jgi:hypothetical protein
MISAPLCLSSRAGGIAKWMLLLALALPGTTLAQTAAPEPPGAAAAPDPPCELHVWPSNRSAANSGGWLSNLGMAGALTDYERNKDGNLRDQLALIEALTPPVQARLLSEAGLAALLDLPDARIVFESGSLDRRSVSRMKTRLSSSAAPCYAELIVRLNFYQKSALYGRKLNSDFTFKDFRGGRSEAKIVSARAGNQVPHFPPATLAETELARGELEQAFTANIREFARKVAARR